MKLVRVITTDQYKSKTQKSRNRQHRYYIDSFDNDSNLIEIEEKLSEKILM